MNAVIFGAGNIGRGFIGALFSQAGLNVTFIDVAKPVVERMNTDHQYPLHIVGGKEEKIIDIKNVCAVDGNDREAAVEALKNGCDYAYIHIEAPDECGHRREPENKVRAIEIIDEQVLPILFEGLKDYDDYKIMILPDHPTPIVTATHASDPVPFMIYHKNNEVPGVDTINEETAKATGLFVESGVQLMKKFLED